MLKLDERAGPRDTQLLVFMEGVIHLTEDESPGSTRNGRRLEEAKEAGRMYVSIMERKGIEKGAG